MADTELPVGATMNDEGSGSPKRASPKQASPQAATSPKQASPKQASLREASPKQASPRAASPHKSPRAASQAGSPRQDMNDNNDPAPEPEVEAQPEPEPEPVDIEKEVDEPAATGSTRRGPKVLKEQVVWNPTDSTIDTVLSQNGALVSSLMGNGFQHLFSGVRASHGVTGGRVVFEVRVADVVHIRKENEKYASRLTSPQPRVNLRFGFGTADASLILGSDDQSIAFTDEGFWIHKKVVLYGGKKNDKNPNRGARIRPGDTFAFILNRDPTSELVNTISTFKNGERFSDPKPIPENMLGETLFPMLSLRNVSVYTNFGNLGLGADGHVNMLTPLPFTVRLMQHTALENIVSSACPVDGKPLGKGGKYELLIPVGVPDEGTFDVIDDFLSKGNNRHLYVEISDRSLMQWCEASLPSARGNDWKASSDRPDFRSGSSCLDDGWIKDCIRSMLPMIKRNVVVMEVCNNLVPNGRAEVLKNFPSSRFYRKALVSIGEPPQAFKDKQLELAIADWKAANPPKPLPAPKATKPEETKPEEKPEEKLEEKPEAATEDHAEENGMNDGEETKDEEKPQVEETKVEEKESEPQPKMDKNKWFRVRSQCDVFSQTLLQNVEAFSLPDESEGLDQVTFEWSDRAACQARLEKLVYDCKMSSKPSFITEPGEGFKPSMQKWMSEKLEWRRKHREYMDKVTAKASEDNKEEPESGDIPEEIDIDSVFNIDDIDGKGQPLYAKFKAEDWALINLRYELFMIVKQWKTDVTAKDPVRVGIVPRLLPWAYSVYFKRTLDARTFGPNRTKIEEVLDLIDDTVKVCEEGYLVSVLDDDAEPAEFVKLTEKGRREREAKIAAGDDSAKVEYKQHTQTENAAGKGGKAAGHLGKGYGRAPAANAKGWGAYPSPNNYAGHQAGKGFPGKGAYGKGGGKGYSAPPPAYGGYKRPMEQQGGYPYQRPRW